MLPHTGTRSKGRAGRVQRDVVPSPLRVEPLIFRTASTAPTSKSPHGRLRVARGSVSRPETLRIPERNALDPEVLTPQCPEKTNAHPKQDRRNNRRYVGLSKGEMAEGEGFEPSVPLAEHDDLANRCLRPLGHPSKDAYEQAKSAFMIARSRWRCQSKMRHRLIPRCSS